MSTTNELGEARIWRMIEQLEEVAEQLTRQGERLEANLGGPVPEPRPALTLVEEGDDA